MCIKMKRTIDSYFGLTMAVSNKRPGEGAATSIQSTVFVNVENKNEGTGGTFKPYFVNYFQKDHHYNKYWEQKYNNFEYRF